MPSDGSMKMLPDALFSHPMMALAVMGPIDRSSCTSSPWEVEPSAY